MNSRNLQELLLLSTIFDKFYKFILKGNVQLITVASRKIDNCNLFYWVMECKFEAMHYQIELMKIIDENIIFDLYAPLWFG